MTSHKTICALSISLPAAILLPTALSSAAITGVTGQGTFLGTSPASCVFGALTGPTAYAWDEQQNVPLNLGVDMTNNPGSSNTPVPGAVNGNYDSHFIHFEPVPGVVGATGTVTFATPITAVIFRAIALDNSDAPAGSFGTIYPTAYSFRGISTNPPSAFSINGNTLSFNFNVQVPSVDIVQVRVLTTPVPTPGTAGLALAGLGLAGVRRRRR